MREFHAGPNDNGARLSRFVQQVTRGLPHAVMHKAFRNRRIKVNGHRAAPDTRLQTGDLIQLYLNDEYFPAPSAAAVPRPAPPLPASSLVYQDAAVAVLYKPAGMLSHSDDTGAPGLLEAFLAHLIATGEYQPQHENTFAPALCNRLDRGTEGLVLAAKTAAALRDAGALIRAGQLTKNYLCVCVGAPPPGLHQAWLTRNHATKTVTVSDTPSPGARAIATDIQLLDHANGLSLCQIGLKTGRTHQIRAHLAHLGAPLLGDAKYGNPALGRRLGVARQALCAWQLAFPPAIPASSSLAHLAGLSFIASTARLPAWWSAFKQGRPTPGNPGDHRV